MRRLLLALLLLSMAAIPANARDPIADARAEWERLPEDKRTHVEVEARLGLITTWITFSPFIAAETAAKRAEWDAQLGQRLAVSGAFCLSAGVAKEAIDEWDYRVTNPRLAVFQRGRTRGAEALDLVADAAGCAVGIGAGATLGSGLRHFVVAPLVGDGVTGAQLTVRF